MRWSALASALRSSLTGNGADRELLSSYLANTFGARRVVLTDSGTSALVMALNGLGGAGRTVALPAYACVDLVAAVRYARVRVRLYDIDPATLSPDLDSVSDVLRQGVDAVVVAHLYGFPADVPGVTSLAAAHGALVIEDAAQGAGGRLHGDRLGSLGAVSVLSFGRGKGMTGGRGGALLTLTPERPPAIDSVVSPGAVPRGWNDLALAASQWLFGRPSLYAVPSAIPGLRLGEMVYHAAHEPAALSIAAATLVRAGVALADREVGIRRRNAEALMCAARARDGLEPILPIGGGAPGYLRFPVRAPRASIPLPALGILRAYPRTLMEESELRPCLLPGQSNPTGALELSRTLFTLPVHGRVTAVDIHRVGEWLTSVSTARPPGSVLAHA